jgi:hypothetical protein
MIWKEYIAHNEIMSAIHFMEKAPYRVRHTYTTEQAVLYSKEMITEKKADIILDGKTATNNYSYTKLTDPVNQLFLPVKAMIEPD